jgi:hypothetical protein
MVLGGYPGSKCSNTSKRGVGTFKHLVKSGVSTSVLTLEPLPCARISELDADRLTSCGRALPASRRLSSRRLLDDETGGEADDRAASLAGQGVRDKLRRAAAL